MWPITDSGRRRHNFVVITSSIKSTIITEEAPEIRTFFPHASQGIRSHSCRKATQGRLIAPIWFMDSNFTNKSSLHRMSLAERGIVFPRKRRVMIIHPYVEFIFDCTLAVSLTLSEARLIHCCLVVAVRAHGCLIRTDFNQYPSKRKMRV